MIARLKSFCFLHSQFSILNSRRLRSVNILILSPYPPYPPYGGGAMRIYQIIRGLAARHAVTCLTFLAGGARPAAAQPAAAGHDDADVAIARYGAA